MTAVIVGMLLVVLAAVAVLAVVAIPQLREGRRVLTPQGRDQVDEARRRALFVASRARQVAGEVADQAGHKVAARRTERHHEPTARVRPAGPREPARRLPPRPRPGAARVDGRLPGERLEPGPRHARR